MADAIRKASADQREAIPGKYQSNKILVEFQRFLAISPRNDGYKANTITYPISYAGKRLHTHRRAGSWIRGKRSETLKYRRFRGNKKGSGIIPEPSMAESEGFEPSSRNQRLTP